MMQSPSVRTGRSGKSGKTGMARIVAAARYSMAGLSATWRREAAIRQEIALTLVLAPLAFLLGRTAVERALLLGSCLLMLIVELLNSAIETVVDRVSVEKHELSRVAKDTGSAAVFVSLVLAAVVWGVIALDRFWP